MWLVDHQFGIGGDCGWLCVWRWIEEVGWHLGGFGRGVGGWWEIWVDGGGGWTGFGGKVGGG